MRLRSSPLIGARISEAASNAVRHDRDAHVGFEQRDQVAFGCDLVAVRHVDPAVAQETAQRLRVLAIGAHQQPLLAQILERHRLAARERMGGVDQQEKFFGEQRPAVEPLPGVADRGRDRELGLTFLQRLGHLGAGAAQQLFSSRLPKWSCSALICGTNSERSIERDSTSRSAPTSPLLIEEASVRAESALS